MPNLSLIKITILFFLLFCNFSNLINAETLNINTKQVFINSSTLEPILDKNNNKADNTSLKNTAANNLNNRPVQYDLAYLDLESLEDYESKELDRAEAKNGKQEIKHRTKNSSNLSIKETDKNNQDKDSQSNKDIKNNNDDINNNITEPKINDPYENYNRFIYSFNKSLDKYTLKPIAKVYSFVNPPPTKHMVTNFFSNIQDATVLVNNLLQDEPSQFADTLTRLILNSTLGFLGLFDVATDIGYPKTENDYGITFGKWGMTESSYFVIPVLGPSTIRDTMGKAVGFSSSYGWFLPPDYALGLTGLFMVDTRTNLFTAEKILETVTENEYEFVRSSYFQYRNYLITGEQQNSKREVTEEKLLDNILEKEKNDATYDKKLKKLDELDELLLE